MGRIITFSDARTQATLERIIEGEKGEGKMTKDRNKAKIQRQEARQIDKEKVPLLTCEFNA